MNREVHVRVWERAEVKFLRATRQTRLSGTTPTRFRSISVSRPAGGGGDGLLSANGGRVRRRAKNCICCLREFSPCPLRGPPNDLATSEYENAQYKPSIKTGGNNTRSKYDYRCDHGEIIRPGVAAVGTSAPACI